jgi:transposase InsO family protein
MQLHPNAKTTPKARALLVQRIVGEGWRIASAAEAAGISRRTAYKWLARFRAGGFGGLRDRPHVAALIPHRTRPALVAAIRALRAKRWSTVTIAQRLGVPRSTVGEVLRRLRLNRLPPLTPPVAIRRYERARPGELLHIDIKGLGRIAGIGHRIHGDRRQHAPRGIGWEYVHVCIDDATRVAYVELRPTLQTPDAVGFLDRAVAWFAAKGIRAERVMTDNGSAYIARAFAAACQRLGLRHLRTRPYTPRTNGKAERFTQTLLREWAYRRPYRSSAFRRRALAPWLRYYNAQRPHMGLNCVAPFTRLQELAA